MSGKDSLPVGTYGFARRSTGQSEQKLVAPHLIENQSNQAPSALIGSPITDEKPMLRRAAANPVAPLSDRPAPERIAIEDPQQKQESSRQQIRSLVQPRLGPRRSQHVDIPMLPGMRSDDAHWVVRSKKQLDTDVVQAKEQSFPRRRRNAAMPVSGLSQEEAPGTMMTGYQGSRRWIAFGLSGMIYAVGIAGLVSMVLTFQNTMNTSNDTVSSELALPPIDDLVDMHEIHREGPFVPRFRPNNDVAASEFQLKS